VAIIMDGNRHWAEAKGLPRVAGHREGVKSVREIVRACREIGIEILTLYAFSVENWKRPRREVDVLMRLLQEFLRRECPNLNKNRVKLKAIGRLKELPVGVQRVLEEVKGYRINNNGDLIPLYMSAL